MRTRTVHEQFAHKTLKLDFVRTINKHKGCHSHCKPEETPQSTMGIPTATATEVVQVVAPSDLPAGKWVQVV